MLDFGVGGRSCVTEFVFVIRSAPERLCQGRLLRLVYRSLCEAPKLLVKGVEPIRRPSLNDNSKCERGIT